MEGSRESSESAIEEVDVATEKKKTDGDIESEITFPTAWSRARDGTFEANEPAV